MSRYREIPLGLRCPTYRLYTYMDPLGLEFIPTPWQRFRVYGLGFDFSRGFHGELRASQLFLGTTMSITSLLGIWVVVKIMVPFWVPIIVRHLIFRVPKKGP